MIPGHIFARPIVEIALQRVIAALDFLHGPANLTHTSKATLTYLSYAFYTYSCLSSKSREYWDENGNWRGIVPIPMGRTLDSLTTSLEGEDRDKFLDLVRGLLRWLPEERLNSYEAFSHP
ncbi:hypothetical protein F4677DRAFT_251131 [Hypoxylon crocopeplum]|nr:hypothetical protein F4677DRAFT_251131 [Hypoxylon crocopeplum]